MNDVTAGITDPKYRRLHRLLEAATLLNSTLDLKEITEIILQIVRDHVPVDRVSAFRVDRKRRIVHSLVAQNAPEELVLPIGMGIAGVVAATGDVLDITDAYSDPRFNSNLDRTFGYRTNDLLGLPIFNREGDVVGVLELLNRKQAITTTDLEFLQQICTYVGLALENASRYREAREERHTIIDNDANQGPLKLRGELADADRLLSIAQALFGIFHHINNPLAVVMGYAGLMKAQPDTDARTQDYLQKIESAVLRAADATRRFAYFAEGKPRHHQVVDAGKLLREVVALYVPDWVGRGIDSTINIQPALVLADANELQLMFMHILANAEDACIRQTERPHIRVQLAPDASIQQVVIEIEDNGPGIPTDLQKRVFEPFWTTKPPGSGIGLGLPLIQSIAIKHGGAVSIEAATGRGTTLSVQLPVFNSEDNRKAKQVPSAGNSL